MVVSCEGPNNRATPDGRIADNIVYFARALRKAGMRVGPASVKDAIEAVSGVRYAVGPYTGPPPSTAAPSPREENPLEDLLRRAEEAGVSVELE